MVKRIIVTILLLPLAEVLVFAAVVAIAGFWPALGLTALSSVAGLAVLRRARARSSRRSARSAVGLAGRFRDIVAVTAGVLLLVPGFITSAIGAALLFPPARHWLWHRLGRWPQPVRSARPEVVDLAPQEWRRVPVKSDRAGGGPPGR